MAQTLLKLSGIQGSGKTTIAKELEKHGFMTIKIDTFYKTVPRVNKNVEWFEDKEYGFNVYKAFEEEIMKQIATGQDVIIESTGFGEAINKVVNHVSQADGIRYIEVFLEVALEEAWRRVEVRNKSIEADVTVSRDDLDFIASKLDEIKPEATFVISTDNKTPKVIAEEILKQIQ